MGDRSDTLITIRDRQFQVLDFCAAAGIYGLIRQQERLILMPQFNLVLALAGLIALDMSDVIIWHKAIRIVILSIVFIFGSHSFSIS